jgi:hypothetical protein
MMSKHPNFHNIINNSGTMTVYYEEQSDDWTVEPKETYYSFHYCSRHDHGIVITGSNPESSAINIPTVQHCSYFPKEITDLDPEDDCGWLKEMYLDQIYTPSGEHVTTPCASLLQLLGLPDRIVRSYTVRFCMGLPSEEDISKVTISDSYWNTSHFNRSSEFRCWLIENYRPDDD